MSGLAYRGEWRHSKVNRQTPSSNSVQLELSSIQPQATESSSFCLCKVKDRSSRNCELDRVGIETEGF